MGHGAARQREWLCRAARRSGCRTTWIFATSWRHRPPTCYQIKEHIVRTSRILFDMRDDEERVVSRCASLGGKEVHTLFDFRGSPGQTLYNNMPLPWEKKNSRKFSLLFDHGGESGNSGGREHLERETGSRKDLFLQPEKRQKLGKLWSCKFFGKVPEKTSTV